MQLYVYNNMFVYFVFKQPNRPKYQIMFHKKSPGEDFFKQTLTRSKKPVKK